MDATQWKRLAGVRRFRSRRMAVLFLATICGLFGLGARQIAGANNCWEWQVGSGADFGGNPLSTLVSKLTYQPAWYSYPDGSMGTYTWNSARLVYNGRFVQAGYDIPPNGYANRHLFFFATEVAQQFIYCEPYWGESYGIGADGQQNGGCYGNADALGLVPGQDYYVQIYVTQDLASGENNQTFGCNGNIRFAITNYAHTVGAEIGHYADCQGASENMYSPSVSSSVLEMFDNGTTYASAVNSYAGHEQMNDSYGYVTQGPGGAGWFESNDAPPYCGYNPPPGAGDLYTQYATYSTQDNRAYNVCGNSQPYGNAGSCGSAGPTIALANSHPLNAPPPAHPHGTEGLTPTPAQASHAAPSATHGPGLPTNPQRSGSPVPKHTPSSAPILPPAASETPTPPPAR